MDTSVTESRGRKPEPFDVARVLLGIALAGIAVSLLLPWFTPPRRAGVRPDRMP